MLLIEPQVIPFWQYTSARFNEIFSEPVCPNLPATLESAWDFGSVFLFLPPSWRHTHAHFGFAHRQQPLRWLQPFLKHRNVKLYELTAPHRFKWINVVIKLGHFVWNTVEPLWKGQESLTKFVKFGPFPFTILYKSCLFYPLWQATFFGRPPSWVAFIEGFHCIVYCPCQAKL